MNRFQGLILLLASSCAHDKAEELTTINYIKSHYGLSKNLS